VKSCIKEQQGEKSSQGKNQDWYALLTFWVRAQQQHQNVKEGIAVLEDKEEAGFFMFMMRNWLGCLGIYLKS